MVKNNPLKDSFRESVFSSKDEFLKVEDIILKRHYAITYNPKDQPDHSLSQGFIDWMLEQKSLFKSMKGCKVRLFLEVSKTGRHHFHGIIQFTNRVKFAVFDTPKLVRSGSTLVKGIGYGPDEDVFDHYAEWQSYCLKIQPDMQEYIHDQITPKICQKDYKDNFDSNYTVSNF